MATKHSSTTKKAKGIIRNEALSRFSNDYGYEDKKTRLQRMKEQADSDNGGTNSRYVSNYRKAKYLVDGGFYRCYYSDQAKFLNKIYGKKTVDKWDGNKIHETYSHLIAREYDSMIEEQRRKAQKKSAKKTTVKKATPKKTATKKTTSKKSTSKKTR